MTENNGEPPWCTFRRMEGGIPGELGRRDRGGMDANKDLMGHRSRFDCLFIAKGFRPTSLMQLYRSHVKSLIGRPYRDHSTRLESA